MREIVVISGKGGTGKTTVCASFAHLAESKVICDLDVDAPDLHILLQPEVKERTPFISGHSARIRQEDCIRCGQCADLCRFEAVRPHDGGFLIDDHCEGCGICVKLCPQQAIDFPDNHCGDWYVSDSRFGLMVHAQLFPGQENSGRLVSLLKAQSAGAGDHPVRRFAGRGLSRHQLPVGGQSGRGRRGAHAVRPPRFQPRGRSVPAFPHPAGHHHQQG